MLSALRVGNNSMLTSFHARRGMLRCMTPLNGLPRAYCKTTISTGKIEALSLPQDRPIVRVQSNRKITSLTNVNVLKTNKEVVDVKGYMAAMLLVSCVAAYNSIEASKVNNDISIDGRVVYRSSTQERKPIDVSRAKLIKSGSVVYGNNVKRINHEYKAESDGNFFKTEIDAGGAANIGAAVYKRNPKAKIGFVIAGNHGILGGGVGKDGGRADDETLKLKTQEETVFGNHVLTTVGRDSKKQTDYYKKRGLRSLWGMVKMEGTSTATKQNIDYTATTRSRDYYLAVNLSGCNLSYLDENKMLTEYHYPAMFSFTAAPNANPAIGEPDGTMQRTLNRKAIYDYDFFRACIKEALRSSLDGMYKDRVTHPIVPPLGCGIYAGKHKARIVQEYSQVLNEVLNEIVGPLGQKRGQYFEEVTFADVPKT
jgi:hypothetical protein